MVHVLAHVTCALCSCGARTPDTAYMHSSHACEPHTHWPLHLVLKLLLNFTPLYFTPGQPVGRAHAMDACSDLAPLFHHKVRMHTQHHIHNFFPR